MCGLFCVYPGLLCATVGWFHRYKEAFKYLMESLELIKVLRLQGQETEKISNSTLGCTVLSWGHIHPHDSVPIQPLFPLGMNYPPALCSILYKAQAVCQCQYLRDGTCVDQTRRLLFSFSFTSQMSTIVFHQQYGWSWLQFTGSTQLPVKGESQALGIFSAWTQITSPF